MDTLPVLYFSFLALLFGLCLGSLWFYGYTIYAAIDYWTHADPEIDPGFYPKLTVLKPLCAANAATYDALRSFCQQDYPHYQIVFTVEDSTNPCIEIVQKLMQQFPDREIQLVVNRRAIGLNSNVNRLANAASAARYGLWVISDSNIIVGPDYLQQIVQPFRYPGIGLVTCPYRSQPQGWLFKLAVLGTAAEFHPVVLMARQMQGVQFALSSTIVIRKDVLQELGGFAAIANTLADDYQLGYLTAKAGFRVMLSHYVVNYAIDQGGSASSFWGLLKRQIAWNRCLWTSQPWSYLGKILTYGTVASPLLLWLLQGSWLGWSLLTVTWTTRIGMGYLVGVGCLKDENVRRYWGLLLLYDLFSLGIWCSSLIEQLIVCRSQWFRLSPHNNLQDPDRPSQSYELP